MEDRPASKLTLEVRNFKSIIIFALLCNFNTAPGVSCQAAQNASTHSPLEVLSSHLSQNAILKDRTGAAALVSKARDSGADQQLVSVSSTMLKTYIRTNNMRAYHLDLHSYRKEARFVGDPIFVDSLNPEHKQRCLRHLSVYDAALKSFRDLDPILAGNSLDAMHLADVYGRPRSSVLFGNQFWLGDYDNCLDIKIKNTNRAASNDDAHDQELISSQYCIGVTQFPNWNPEDGKTSIKVGLCLPETCTSSMLSDDSETLEKVETMMKYQFGSNQPYDRLKLRQVYCLPHESSEIRKYSATAIGLLTILGAFATTTLIATLIDYFKSRLPENLIEPKRRTWKTIVVESFSLTRNIDKFFHVSPDDKQQVASTSVDDDSSQSYDRSTFLNSITGIKCIGLIWIVCAHVFLVTPIVEKNLINLDKMTKTFLADIYLTAHLMVDTFFALSGLLASFFIFRAGIDKMKLSSWIVATVHRYWRLTPIYLACYCFTKSVGMLINEGPLWDYMTAEQSPRLNCYNESWWVALLHLSDFKSPKDHCVPFAWFIANGIKFWLVTPFFLITIHQSIKRGYLAVLLTIISNIILVAYLALKSNVDVKSVIEFKPESADNMLNNMGEVYTRPYSRIGAYLIGLVAGHLMYLIDAGKLEVKLSKNVKIAVWTVFTVTVISLTFMLKLANTVELDDSAMLNTFAISSALIRPLWALCSCWLVFAMAHGQAKWLTKFLTARLWRVFTKLSFCGYLIQGEVLAQIYLAKSSSDSFNYVEMICRPIIANFMTCFVSFFMVILLEYPLCGIEEIILPRHTKSSPAEKEKLTESSEISPTVQGGEKLKSA